jgi:ferredoxin
MTLIARIDDYACLAHGDCAAIAPQVFALEDIALVVGDGPDELLRSAAHACPAGAIMLVDAESGDEAE